VLFYVEPDGGDYFFHQVVNHDGFQADLKIGFTSPDEDENERRAYAVLDAVDQNSADKVISIIEEMMGREE
jgi:hypothetical protein